MVKCVVVCRYLSRLDVDSVRCQWRIWDLKLKHVILICSCELQGKLDDVMVSYGLRCAYGVGNVCIFFNISTPGVYFLL